MSQYVDQQHYEYTPINVSYSNIGFGYRFAEGVGINASGGIRGSVVIHEYSTNEVLVSVFSDTAVRKLAPNSWRQATVTIAQGDKVLARQVVGKFEPYIIATSSEDIYLGSVRITLPPPTGMAPLQVIIKAISMGCFPEGNVPGVTQEAKVSIAVRKVAMP